MQPATQSGEIHPSVTISLAICRGIIGDVMTHPLWTIKTIQQANFHDDKSTYRVAREIINQHGCSGFYRGLGPQLMRTVIKQPWCWPLMVGVPPYLEAKGVHPDLAEISTGFAIASINSLLTPLEKETLTTMIANKKTFSMKKFLKEGWIGTFANWRKLSVSWATFMVAQKHFSGVYLKEGEGKALSNLELIDVGVKTSIVVSLCTAPFDIANTVKLSKNLAFSSLLSGNFKTICSRMYRGWFPSLMSSVINNIASAALFDLLRQRALR